MPLSSPFASSPFQNINNGVVFNPGSPSLPQNKSKASVNQPTTISTPNQSPIDTITSPILDLSSIARSNPVTNQPTTINTPNISRPIPIVPNPFANARFQAPQVNNQGIEQLPRLPQAIRNPQGELIFI